MDKSSATILLACVVIASVTGARGHRNFITKSEAPLRAAVSSATGAADRAAPAEKQALDAATAMAWRLGQAARLADGAAATALMQDVASTVSASPVVSDPAAASDSAAHILRPNDVPANDPNTTQSRGSEPTASQNIGQAVFAIWRRLSETMTVKVSALTYLMHGITFMIFIKGVCMAGNFLVQTIPLTQVREWESRGCTGDADAAPYVSIAFGGWQWCFYGTFSFLWTRQEGFLILVQSNFLGAILGTYYTYCFFRHCQSRETIECFQRYISGITFLVVIQMVTICMLSPPRALLVSGSISSLCSFIGAVSMLVPVPAVVRNKDSSSIPGLLVVAYFLSSLAWCICGYLIRDPLVAGPNVAAGMACLTCMILKIMYPEVKKTKDADYALAVKALESLMPASAQKLGRFQLVKETASDANSSHDFQFCGASGYAGGNSAYGSAGTGGTF